jgi:hypothetical protein
VRIDEASLVEAVLNLIVLVAVIVMLVLAAVLAGREDTRPVERDSDLMPR